MRIVILIGLLISEFAFAQSSSMNVQIPTTASSYQSDRIRAGDIECQNAIGSSTNLEFGVVGIINQEDPYGLNTDPYFDPNVANRSYTDVGVYARVVIPIGAPKERINCNALYKLELRKKELEVQRLEQEIRNLRSLQFQE